MTDLVVWAGPVNAVQVKGATVPGATEHFFGCVGDVQPGKPHCPSIADRWHDAEGRRLPNALKAIGLNEDTVGCIFLGAFSAGGSIHKRLLEHPADRARITGVMLHDATYSSTGTDKNAAPIDAFARFAEDAASDPSKFMLATASSSPNKSYGSGEQVLDATRKLVEDRLGRSFVEDGELPVSVPAKRLLRLGGNVIFGYYGSQGGGHALHPKLAPELWQNVLVPWLEGSPVAPPGPGPKPPVPGGPPSTVAQRGAKIISLLVGVTVGFVAVSLAERWARRTTK